MAAILSWPQYTKEMFVAAILVQEGELVPLIWNVKDTHDVTHTSILADIAMCQTQ